MEKKEIYDYLAKIYLDNNKQRPREDRGYFLKKYWFFLIGAIAIAACVFFFYSLLRHPVESHKAKLHSLYLATGNELIKIRYNFSDDSALRKESYTIASSGLNVQDFQQIKFLARRLKNEGSLNLKIEIENSLKEVAFYYITGLTNKWKEFTISLKNDFKEISRWDNIKRISFVAEEWNTEEKDDVIYIDEIRFSRLLNEKEGL